MLDNQVDLGDDGLRYFNDEPFTGVIYVLSKNGSVEAEDEYRDGLLWGLSRGWHPSGQLAFEFHNEAGLRTGMGREWHENGRLASETLYEFGLKKARKGWDLRGTLVEDYQLKESDPDYKTLLIYRRAYGTIGGDQEPTT